MRERPWLAPVVIAVALAMAYFPLVTNQGLVITDDTFTSDITNAEWPGRIEMGNAIREGSWPLWSRGIYGGVPFLAPGPGTEPLTLLLFSLLPPVAAVNAYIMFVLLLAGIGTSFFVRALGGSTAGGAAAGLGFAFSGYMVCQLKHLTIVSCIAWAPWALLALYRAFEVQAQPSRARTAKWLGVFTLVYGMQWLVGFAQSAYIATLLYVAWGFTLIIRNRVGRGWVKQVVAFGVAGIGGVLIGAIQLIASLELTKLSDRNQGVTIEWATRWNYWLPQLWSFIIPYKNGDFGEQTYVGQGIFWEDYSYTGLVTLLLALVTFGALRKSGVRFWAVTAVVALLLVLGKHTFVFPLAFRVLPGLSFFRFPTRFLFVVHLALSVLAGLGLTQLEAWLSARKPATARLAPVIAWLLVGFSFADLQFFQLRQNPIANADRWMTPPASVTFLRENLGEFRAFSFGSKISHANAMKLAHGWVDLEPYYAVRDFVQPSSNLMWNIDMADGYMGLLTREAAFLWGSSQVGSRVDGLGSAAMQNETNFPQLARVLRTFGVKYVLSPLPLPLGAPIPLGNAVAYELPSPAPRFHFATRTQGVENDDAAFTLMRSGAFDPTRDVVWVGPSQPQTNLPDTTGATILPMALERLSLELRVSSPSDAVLVNNESFHPGWLAEVDGRPVEVRRANINQRAVQVPAGDHVVRFSFDQRPYRVGLAITLLAIALATLVTIWSWRRDRAFSYPAAKQPATV